jgi:hypothetical protein
MVQIKCFKKQNKTKHGATKPQWLTPIILATQKVESGRIAVPD